MSLKRFIAVGAVLLAAASLKAQDAEKSGEKADSPKTHKVAKEDFRLEVKVKGNFESAAVHEVSLRPEVWTSLVVLKAVDHGVRVKKGDPIVWLDTQKIDLELERLRMGRQLNKIALKLADIDLQLAEDSLSLDLEAAERAKNLADDELKYFTEVDRPLAERSAKFSLKSSEQRVEYAAEELKQLLKMYEADDITEETEEIILKRARNDMEYAEFSLERSRITTDNTLSRTLPRTEERMTEAARRQDLAHQKARATLPMEVGRKRLERDKLVYEHEQAEQKLRKLAADREALTIRAPSGGIVYYGRSVRGKAGDSLTAASRLKKGGVLSPNEVFMTVVSPRPLRVRAELEEKDLQHVRPGTTGKTTPTALPRQHLPTSVKSVSYVPLRPGTFDCTLEMEGDVPQQIMPGMSCSVILNVYDAKNALTLPAGAVFSDDDKPGDHYVYLAGPNGAAKKQPVEVGQRTDEKVEILEGLKEGDEVLASKPKADK